MAHPTTNAPRVKAALFVDFDNIYIGLHSLDPEAAHAFATNPSAWLFWLEEGMPTLHDYGEHELPKRSLLLRRVYLNPAVMGRRDFRAHFIRAGFSVTDCPSVTAQGKNNADILMVMDILDNLTHRTSFDEFIILSGDSDFTPVLLRLRAHDRRTAIITAGPAAEAYRAAADRTITPDLFIEFGLGLTAPLDDPAAAASRHPGTPAPDAVLDKMATAIHDAAHTSGELDGAAVPLVLKQFDEFKRRHNWMGFWTLRRLALELVRRNPKLRWIESDPWKIGVTEVRLPPGTPEQPAAVPYALPALIAAEGAWLADEEPAFAEFVRYVHRVTEAPLLSQAQYHMLFDLIAQEVAAHGYHFIRTAKAVRDKCLERGHPLSRASVAFVLRGVIFAGHRLSESPEYIDPAALADAFRQNVENRCRTTCFELEGADAMLRRWLMNGVLGQATMVDVMSPNGT
jgi:NYN domain